MANGKDVELACPICDGELAAPLVRLAGNMSVKCPNCGEYRLTESACKDMPSAAKTPVLRAVLAHQVAKLSPGTLVTTYLVRDLLQAGQLPEPLERIDLLIRYLAGSTQVGQTVPLVGHHLKARLGCADSGAVHWVIRQAEELKYIVRSGVDQLLGTLTLKGWQRHQELERSGASSRHAFMAMRFGDEELDQVFREHLRPAVKKTGFDLRTTVGPHQTAGSIDDRMRVELRTSRFVVCDLTHGNRGAYWEAGFAEGLGRPVFYVCRRDVLQSSDPDVRPHFDTSHQLILTWSLSTIADDMDTIKAAMRATLPAEAHMEE